MVTLTGLLNGLSALDPSLGNLIAAAQTPSQAGRDILVKQAPAEAEATPDIVVKNNARPVEYTPGTYQINPDSVPSQPTMINQAPDDTSPYPRTEASPQEVANASRVQGLPQHKSPLGAKGTLRDVLGTLQDVIQVGLGMSPTYGAKKQQENIADALAGYGSRPTNEVAQRVAAAGDPQLAYQLMTQGQTKEYQRQQIDAKKVDDERLGTQSKLKNLENFQTYAASLLGAAAKSKDPKAVEKAYSQIAKIGRNYNMVPEDLGVTMDMSKDDAGFLSRGKINPYQQETLEDKDLSQASMDSYRKAQAASAAKSANARMISATKPSAASQTPRIQNTEEYQTAMSRMSKGGYESLSTADKAVLNAGGVRPPAQKGRRALGASSGAKTPPVGYVNKHGRRFTGGDPNDIKNWK